MIRDSNPGGANKTGVAAVLAVAMLAFLFCLFSCPRQPMAFIDLFDPKYMIEMMKQEEKQRKIDQRFKEKVEQMEKIGGAEGSKGLFEVLTYRGDDEPSESVRSEALRAMARLKRPEDVPSLIELYEKSERDNRTGWYEILSILGEFGGDEACRFLRGYIHDRPRRPDFKIDIKMLAMSIIKAECMPEEELHELLWEFARDVWADDSLQKSSLVFLESAGDQKAAELLKKYESLTLNFKKRVSHADVDFLIEEAIQHLADPRIPWWVRKGIMANITNYGSGSKEDFLDIIFEQALVMIQNKPEVTYGDIYRPIGYGKGLITERRTTTFWTRGNGEDYLRGKRAEYQATLSGKELEHMDTIAKSLLEFYHEVETRKKEKKEIVARPVLPPGISDKPFPEPYFISVNSRIGKAELFCFDKDFHWYGLVPIDLFLASVIKETEGTDDEEKKESLRFGAIQAQVIENQLPQRPGGSSYPLLLPLSVNYDFDTGEPDWSQETRTFNAGLIMGEEHFILLRALDTTGINLFIGYPSTGGGKGGGDDIEYQFSKASPAGTWLICRIPKEAGDPLVFLSETGHSLTGRYRLMPGRTRKNEPLDGGEYEASVMKSFQAARDILEKYKNEAFTAAGGEEGLKDYREKLLKGIEELSTQ